MYSLARGVDTSDKAKVKVRELMQSVGCGKTFKGKPLKNSSEVQHYLRGLAGEISNRLQEQFDNYGG